MRKTVDSEMNDGICPHCGQEVPGGQAKSTPPSARREEPPPAPDVVRLVDKIGGAFIELARAQATGSDPRTERLLNYASSDDFKERLSATLRAVDDLRNLQAEECKRHEAAWGAREEAYGAIERFTGRIQAQVRAIVEGEGT